MLQASTATLAATLWLAASAAGQTSWLVGPNGLPDVQAAIDGAQPGDEVVVEPGTYARFVVDKPLTVRAQVHGTVQVLAGPGHEPVYVATGAHPGTTRLVGLEAQRLLVQSSHASIEDCTFTFGGVIVFVLVGTAHFERCGIFGLGQLANQAPLHGSYATISMNQCTVLGPPQGATPFAVNRGAMHLVGSTLVASDCALLAGAGNAQVPLIHATTTSTVQISDSALVGSAGACIAFGGGEVQTSRCSVTPACAAVATADLLGARSNGPLTRGQLFQLHLTSNPHEPLFVWASTGLHAAAPGFLQQPLLLAADDAFPVEMQLADATGAATFAYAVPNTALPPGAALYLQAVGGTALPLQASPVVGGLLR